MINAIRKLITGIDPVELAARLANIENGGAYAREVAHGVQAEVVHARGGQESLLDALASKATRADVAQLHTRADLIDLDLNAVNTRLDALTKPLVSPLQARAGITEINGRLIDADGKLVTEVTGEPNLNGTVQFGWTSLADLPTQHAQSTLADIDMVAGKTTKARKPRAPKGGGK